MTAALSSTAKENVRREALARRDALEPSVRSAAADTIAQRGLPVAVASGAVVSGFMPIRSEINPLPLMRRLAQGGARLALPIVIGRGQPLEFRAWALGDPLDRGQWGIRQPQKSAPIIDPDVVLTPLAAFDRAGYRVGYGAGYYDMSLNALRARKAIVAIGIAFALQEVEAVPREPHDARLDFVVTERESIRPLGA